MELRKDGQPRYAIDRLKLEREKLREINAELLEALKGILPAFDNEGTTLYAKIYADRIKTAEQAIAKAEGRRSFMTKKDIEKVWDFLGGKESEYKDTDGRIYIWPTLEKIYKDELIDILLEREK